MNSSVSQTVTGYDKDVALVNAFHRESLLLGKAHLATSITKNDTIGEKISKPSASLDGAIFPDTDFMLLVLLNEKQCDDVCFGSNDTTNQVTKQTEETSLLTNGNGLISILLNNSCVVFCSTVSAGWAMMASAKFRSDAKKHKNRNISFVDCPILGGPARAQMGTLTVVDKI